MTPGSEVGPTADRPLHPATLLGRFLRQLPNFVVGLPVLLNIAADPDARTLILVAAIGVLASGAAALAVWRRFRWGVGARELVIERGVIFRQRRVIPFTRVEDVDIEQGPLARLFGTARVRVETGGAGKDEGTLDSIALADARALRDLIRAARAGRTAAAPPVPQKEPLLFAMDLRRVLLAGLLGFSLLYVGALAAALQYLEPLFDWDAVDPDRWLDFSQRLGPARAAAAGSALIALVLLVALAAGMVRALTRDYGFRLTRTPSGFRRRRGLLTLSEVVIPRRRVQLGLVRSGLIGRGFGWHALDFQTLGADPGQSGRQQAAPLARLAEIGPILAEAALPPLPPGDAMQRVSARHILRQSIRWSALLAAPALGTTIADPRALYWLAAVPLLALLAGLQYRHHRYLPGETALFVRAGIFTHRVWILPYARVQSVTLRSTPLQRALGLASLLIDTAGASEIHDVRVRNLPAATAATLFPFLVASIRRQSR